MVLTRMYPRSKKRWSKSAVIKSAAVILSAALLLFCGGCAWIGTALEELGGNTGETYAEPQGRINIVMD